MSVIYCYKVHFGKTEQNNDCYFVIVKKPELDQKMVGSFLKYAFSMQQTINAYLNIVENA